MQEKINYAVSINLTKAERNSMFFSTKALFSMLMQTKVYTFYLALKVPKFFYYKMKLILEYIKGY
jgi:RAB protein geranylgeranyltransferase component A